MLSVFPGWSEKGCSAFIFCLTSNNFNCIVFFRIGTVRKSHFELLLGFLCGKFLNRSPFYVKVYIWLFQPWQSEPVFSSWNSIWRLLSKQIMSQIHEYKFGFGCATEEKYNCETWIQLQIKSNTCDKTYKGIIHYYLIFCIIEITHLWQYFSSDETKRCP